LVLAVSPALSQKRGATRRRKLYGKTIPFVIAQGYFSFLPIMGPRSHFESNGISYCVTTKGFFMQVSLHYHHQDCLAVLTFIKGPKRKATYHKYVSLKLKRKCVLKCCFAFGGLYNALSDFEPLIKGGQSAL